MASFYEILHLNDNIIMAWWYWFSLVLLTRHLIQRLSKWPPRRARYPLFRNEGLQGRLGEHFEAMRDRFWRHFRAKSLVRCRSETRRAECAKPVFVSCRRLSRPIRLIRLTSSGLTRLAPAGGAPYLNVPRIPPGLVWWLGYLIKRREERRSAAPAV